jgi:hypothetical protein
MQNFDYESGHIPYVMGMPYEEFAAIHSYWDATSGAYPMGTEPYMAPGTVAYSPLQEAAAWEAYATAAHDAPLYAEEMAEFAAWEQSLGSASIEPGMEPGFGQTPANEEWHH